MKHHFRPLLSKTLSASLGLCAFSLPWLAASSQAQVVFSQNFSSSNNTGDYMGSGANQFDGLLANTGNSLGVTNNALQFAKTGDGSASINRITALPTAGKAASFQFSLSASGVTTNTSTTDLIFQVGSVFTNSTGAENAGVYQNFNIDLQGGSVFQVGGIGPTFSGLQTITLDLNNTGATVNFTTPGGGTLALNNDNFAIFVGTTNILSSGLGVNQLAVGTAGQGNAALDITQFKLRYQATGENGTVAVDDFVVTVVPEPSTYALLGLGLAGLGAVVARRRRPVC